MCKTNGLFLFLLIMVQINVVVVDLSAHFGGFKTAYSKYVLSILDNYIIKATSHKVRTFTRAEN